MGRSSGWLVTAFLSLPGADGGAQGASELQARLREARQAVEGDSADRVAARWTIGLARRPGHTPFELGLASIDRLTYEYDRAWQRYTAIERRLPPNDPVVAHARFGMATVLGAQRRTADAVTALERAIESARASGVREVEAEALMLLGRLRARTIGMDTAHALLRRAEAVLPPGDTRLQAAHRCQAAELWASAGSPRADTLARDGLGLARRARDLRVESYCHFVLGQELERQGRQWEAYDAMVAAERASATGRDWALNAAVQQWLGFFHLNAWALASARDALERALVRGSRSRNWSAVGWAHLNLADLATRLGDPVAARASARQARALLEPQGDRFGLALLSRYEAEALASAGRMAAAESAFASVEATYRSMRFLAHLPALRFRLATLARERGELDLAESRLVGVLRLADSLGNVGWRSNAQYERARIALARGVHATAIREWRAYIATVPRVPFQAGPYLRIAEAAAHLGDWETAEEALDSASVRIVAYQRNLVSRDLRIGVVRANPELDRDPDYGVATVLALMVAAGRTERAFRVAEENSARLLLAALALRRTLAGDSVHSHSELGPFALGPWSLEQLRAALPVRGALLHYVTGPGQAPSTVFTLTRSGLTAARLPPIDSLRRDIASFLALLEGGSEGAVLARQLGRRVLAPALASLPADIEQLVIVPHGDLHLMPWDALEPDSGVKVFERFTVSVVPSATVFRLLRSSPAVPQGGILAFGDPTFSDTTRHPRLPGSGAEARRLGRLWPGAVIRLGNDASEQVLKRATGRVGILHLATHAEVVDHSPLGSAILLTAGGGEDGRVGVEELAALKLVADLVVLSSCRTGRGYVAVREGMQGLVAPLLETGARAVVATHWPIRDRTEGGIVDRFYRHLRQGEPVARAMRLARRDGRAAGLPASEWAAFAVFGDGGLRFSPRGR